MTKPSYGLRQARQTGRQGIRDIIPTLSRRRLRESILIMGMLITLPLPS